MNLKEPERQSPIPEQNALKGLKRADFFLKAASFAEEQIQTHPDFLSHINRFGQDRRQVAIDAVVNHQFGAVTEEDEFRSLLVLSHQKQDIWRGLALDRLEQGEDLGFNPEETRILKAGLKIGSIMDNVYMRYREELIYSELGKRLSEMTDSDIADFMARHNATNPYTTYKEEDGEIAQIPFSQAFQDEYNALDGVLDALLTELNGLPESTQPFIPYFEACRKALMETNLNALEERWKEVDMLWMNIKGDFQPVHAMEHYLDPTRSRIDPEFRIVIADEKGRVVNEQAILTQQRLIRDMTEVYGGYDSFNTSSFAMKNSVVLAGTTVVMSGANLNFRLTGQVVPNDGEVRTQRGVKIFLDLRSFEIRSQLMEKFATGVFGNEFARDYFVDPDFRIAGGMIVVGHEVNHNAFITPDTDSRLGNYTLVEETKADLGPYITLPRQLERGEITRIDVERALTSLIATNLRGFIDRDQLGHRPYYILAVIETNLMINAGLVYKEAGQWKVDFSPEKMDHLFNLTQIALTDLADAYNSYSQPLTQKFLDMYFYEGPEILELVKLTKAIQGK